MQEFENKVAVVTGGSSGIGLSIAKKLDEAGAKVALFARDEKKLLNEAKDFKNALTFSGDVSKISDLNRFYQAIEKKWGKIDMVVANAGISEPCPVFDVNEALFDKMVNINYKGVYFTVQRALKILNGQASIVLISSTAAHIGWAGHSVYSSTKAAVSYLAKSFSAELIEKGIRVNALSPGMVDTPIFDAERANSELMKTLAEIIPVKRFASPEEIADAALFLLSSHSKYIVGEDIVIDGGLKAVFKGPKFS